MKAFIAVIYIIDFILIIVTILNLERLDQEREKLNKKQIRLIDECININRKLTNKMIAINLITFSSISSEEKIQEIEKVIHSSDQTDIDNF